MWATFYPRFALPRVSPARAVRTPAEGPSVPAGRTARPATGTSTGRSRSTAGDDFTAAVDPRPLPAVAYKSTYANHYRWGSMEFGPQVGVGRPHLPIVAEAGKPYHVEYGRMPDHIGLTGTLQKVTLNYRIDGGAVNEAVIAEGESATAYALRTPHRIDVPQGATGEIEYWFELETADGKTEYDSNFGNNYRANIVPRGGAILRFDDLWGETLSEPIKEGSTLRLA
jgi:hypothetical protein